MHKDITKKVAREKAAISFMIHTYCKHHHGQAPLCPECQELLDYAYQRIEGCPFKKTKTFCSACKVHCYQKDMREKIRIVMRFSGPHMLFHHPLMALHHLYIERKEKR